jgi:hypothetical protein
MNNSEKMSGEEKELGISKEVNDMTDNSVIDEFIPDNNHLIVEGKTPQISSERTSVSGVTAVVDEKQPVAPEEVSPRNIHGWRWGLAVISILSSIFLFALDNTIVADIQPAIVETFGSVGKLPWLSVAFLLAAASTNLIFGKVYTQFNTKWCYMGCVFVFEAGSAICGAANSMELLIFGRAVCGLGGVGMVSKEHLITCSLS